MYCHGNNNRCSVPDVSINNEATFSEASQIIRFHSTAKVILTVASFGIRPFDFCYMDFALDLFSIEHSIFFWILNYAMSYDAQRSILVQIFGP